ncbi:MAG: thioredoxin domain-containing protein [Bacteroidetes bacterium]|nr:thioredoxin domain-containing protein [Bacteroidota bacterium]
MNLLQYETSPYLLQHANNPVHWQAWSEAAFEQAATENKPVLLSIGYSSCHWCHVMEHESFENEEVATLMNNLFVNIKLDREEYPDIDHLYMDAVQAMTGSGGWPLNVFLTPDKKAFFGGTYFPPMRAHGRASWKEILINVSQYYSQNREEVEQQANQLMTHLAQAASPAKMKATLSFNMDDNKQEIDQKLFEKIMANADKEYGGFGKAPKFPSTFAIKFLLVYYDKYGDADALKQACISLDKMALGGIYDHLGGGFSRYSTDTFWIAPHFEKMLYDNALLIEVYSIAYSYTRNHFYKNIVEQTIQWLEREMMNTEYAFYSAQDADSEGVEGKYYTWETEELQHILQDDFEFAKQYFQIQPQGNWEHTNILYTTEAHAFSQNPTSMQRLSIIKESLLEKRNLRIKPLTDDKILLGWNALMNQALSLASLIFDNPHYLFLAEKNMAFIWSRMKSEEYFLFHTSKNNQHKIPAYLDDLAYTASALLQLNTATADTQYLHLAREVLTYIEGHFFDEKDVLFHFANTKFQNVRVPKKEIYDGALPSSNAVLCKVFYHMGFLFNQSRWIEYSQTMLNAVMPQLQNYPASYGVWAVSLLNRGAQEQQIVVLGPKAKPFIATLHNKRYLPNVLFVVSGKKDDSIGELQGKYDERGTRIFVCQNNACLSPFTSIEEAMAVIFKEKF